MLKISYVDRVTNNEVGLLKGMHTELHFRRDVWRERVEFAGHALIGSGGNWHLCILEGKVCGRRFGGEPGLARTDATMGRTGLGSFGAMGRVAEDRDKCRTIIVN